MSLAPSDSPGRARNRMARSLFLMFWSVSLLPVLLLGGVGYGLFSAQLQHFSGAQWRTVVIAFAGIAALMGLLSLWLGRRVVAPLRALIGALTRFTEGDWDQRAQVDREDEMGQLAQLFNAVADEMKELYNLLAIREGEEQGGEKRSALMQLAQVIETAPDAGELQRGALEMIVKMFACSFAALYLIERVEPVGVSYAVLANTYGRLEGLPGNLGKRFSETRINLDATPTMDWMVGKTLASRRAQVGPASEKTGSATLPVLAEATLPLIRRAPDGSERLIGVLDLYAGSRMTDSRLGPFANRPLSELQAIANLIALAVSSMSSPGLPSETLRSGAGGEGTGVQGSSPAVNAARIGAPTGPRPGSSDVPTTPLKASVTETLTATPSLLPLAGATLESFFIASRLIAQAVEADQVLEAAGGALRQSPFINAMLIPGSAADGPQALEVFDCRREPVSMRTAGQSDLAVEPLQEFFLARQGIAVIVDNIGKRLSEAKAGTSHVFNGVEPAATAPQTLLEVAQRIGAESAAFIPALHNERLIGLLVVGRPPKPALRNLQSPPLNPALLEPYANLVYLTASALQRVYFQGGTQRRLAELESLWQVSQTIAAETHLEAIFPILHEQLEIVMGKLSSFATLIYESNINQVYIPYIYEEGKLLQVPSFQLGSSLSSHVIRTRQPLLLRNQQEVNAMSQQVGMIQIGEDPQSWLGVPMLFAGEVLGAIVVQDVHQENRFNADDQRLLSTLATQAAVVVRNARLLESSHQQVQHEQLVNEISDRIRSSVDIESILKTTADELGRALGARRAHIQIAAPGNEPDAGDPALPGGGGAPGGARPFDGAAAPVAEVST